MKNFDGFNDSETLACFVATRSHTRLRGSDLECGRPAAAFPNDSHDPIFGEAQ
jgi:hypothetical protein